MRGDGPTTGQFLTIDTTGHPYAYVGNNPLQYTDPTGLCADCTWFETLVLKGPSTETLTTGFTGGVVNSFTAIGDNATLGLTTYARNKIAPGSSCFINTNNWAYQAGIVDILDAVARQM